MSRKRPNWWLRVGLVSLTAAVVIQFLAVGFPAYGAPLRRLGYWVATLLGRLFSVLPFPVSEWLILGVPVALIVTIVWLLRKYGPRQGGKRLLSRLLCGLGVVALLFVLSLGVQYGAPSVSETLGLPTGQYSAEQLGTMTEYLLTQANAAAAKVPRDSDGHCAFGDYRPMAQGVMEAYRAACAGGSRYRPVAGGSLSPAAPKKTLLLGKVMSYLDISGYYFPWTGEAVVSSDSLDMTLPYTIAHEAAHAHGVGPEDEANFVAFLTAVETSAGQGDPLYAYSTWFMAYRFASNALYSADYSRWAEVYAQRSLPLMQDMADLQAHLDKYDTPVRDIGSAVNDTYIKATGQPDGVRSYGKVVDLMLAWYYTEDSP